MNIVAYGGGTDSTAMIIECFNRGIKLDHIVFADTGGEKPHTYQYVKIFSQWCADHGLPEIITVRKAGNNETSYTVPGKFIIGINTSRMTVTSDTFFSGISTQNAPMTLIINNSSATHQAYNAILHLFYDCIIQIDTQTKQVVIIS
jgi:hypothetical protein